MQGLEELVRETRQLQDYIDSIARSDFKASRLQRLVKDYNGKVESVRQSKVIDPFYRLEDLESWQKTYPHKKAVSPLSHLLIKYFPQFLPFILGEPKYSPTYRKECCYCSSPNPKEAEFTFISGDAKKRMIHMVCPSPACQDQFIRYCARVSGDTTQHPSHLLQ